MTRKANMRAWLSLPLVIAFVGAAHAFDEVDFLRDIKPLLAEKCAACHGALQQQAGLRLDAGMLVRKGSDSGQVIVPGKAGESLLIQRVSAASADERMPPEGEGEPLAAKQIALLAAWIDAGAIVPEREEIPPDPRTHWAYQRPQRPQLPQPADPRWSHAIDAFIAAGHLRQGLTPVEMADRHTLLRRVYFDLIGLPPTRHQIEEFLQDDSPTAWQRVVDELLASPHYGERWGRHWMDVWRYSDWDGYKQQLRGSQRHIWRWRDWIVQSLNGDKGYDRMILEMLAGDEMEPQDESVLSATGFLARNYHVSNRNIWLDATVEHTAKAFLALTLNCARCHDHKYDPIPQEEYYRFRAILEPHNVRTDRLPGQADLTKDGVARAFDADLTAKTFLYEQGNEKRPDKEHPLGPAVPAVLGGTFDVKPVELPVEAYFPAIRQFIAEEDLRQAQQNLAAAEEQLAAAPAQGEDQPSESSGDPNSPEAKQLEIKHKVAEARLRALETRLAADRAKYLGQSEASGETARQAAHWERQLNLREAELAVFEKQGEFDAANAQKDERKKQAAIEAAQKALTEAQKKLQAAQKAIVNPDDKYTSLGQEYPRTSSGRRSALAKWIASRDNPLTARVAVNHLWMRHFGAPLVEDVFDFGLRTPRPQHAELLDWLAIELMDNNWSMKHLHRLIVTSRTWRLASGFDASTAKENQRIDPDNRLLWRANVRRLDAEIVRDAVLAVSGQLDPALEGPEIDFRQGETSRRRSIYLRHAYEKQMTMLVLFDAASPTECYRRSQSIVPQQALAMANSSLTLGKSRLLARQLWREVASGDGEQAEFVRAAFLQLLGRPPADEELAQCVAFLARQATILSDPSKLTRFVGGSNPQVQPAADPHARARESLVHVLMNHNDFISVR